MSDSSAKRTRSSLLVRIRDVEDATSWKTFVDLYAPMIYNYCRRKGLQDADAADVAQEVMTEVARCIRSFEYQPERGRFRDWLGTVTRRQLARFFERRKRAARTGQAESCENELEQVAGPQADPEWTDDFNAQIVRIALQRIRPHFEPPTWRAFELVWLENRSAADAAAILQISVSAIYVAKSRVLKRLEEEVLTLAEESPFLARDS